MDQWVRAVLRVYEFTAVLVITILPALATVYAIIVSFLGRLVRRADVEFKRLKKENEERIAARRKELSRRDKRRKTTIEALAEVKGWEDELKGLIKKEENWKKQVEGWSFPAIFVKPAGWILGGLLGIFVAYGALNVLPSDFYGWRILLSLLAFLGGLACVAVGLCKHVIPCLVKIDESARKPEESPVETMQRILREQTEQSGKEQREAFERLIGKMDEVVTLLNLKEPDFEVHFLVDNKPEDTLRIKKDEEQWAAITIDNHSDFPIREGSVELILPAGFAMRERSEDEPSFRPDHLTLYPGGAKLQSEIGRLGSNWQRWLPFLIKGEEVSDDFKMHVWIVSTSHKSYEATLKVIVKK